jgi:hypothetical protein
MTENTPQQGVGRLNPAAGSQTALPRDQMLQKMRLELA